jgi:hypothetical protein
LLGSDFPSLLLPHIIHSFGRVHGSAYVP